MIDPMSKLERELRAMRPRALSDDLLNPLMQSTTRSARWWGDWCLVGAMGSGLAAAVVIVALLSAGMMSGSPVEPALPGSPSVAQGVPQRAGDSLMMFARADDGWNGVLK
jgi:hypothetical protein